MRPARLDAAELAAVVRRRFPRADAKLEEDLISVEEAARTGDAGPRAALALAQKLYAHGQQLQEMARAGWKQPRE